MRINAAIVRVTGAGGAYAYTITVDGTADTVDIGNATVGAAFNEVRDRVVALVTGPPAQTVQRVTISVDATET